MVLKLLRRLGINKAVLFYFSHKSWMLLATGFMVFCLFLERRV